MNAYIIAGYRSAVGKSGRGGLRFTLPVDLASGVIKHLMATVPNIKPEQIDDLIVGCSNPEAEQGLNLGRQISLIAFDSDKVPGETVNRYCSSGLDTIALASAKIHAGMAECIIAGGVESMSIVPMGGLRVVPDPKIVEKDPTYYWGMGLTAEAVANEFNISRADQDAFAFASHQKALKAIKEGTFKDDIAPIKVSEVYLDETEKRKTREYIFDTDEGPRADTTIEGLAKLRPVFHVKGSVTAGNSSQTSDGAAFVIVMSERLINELGLKPIARLVNAASAGVHPRIMGIGPVAAIPKALKQAATVLGAEATMLPPLGEFALVNRAILQAEAFAYHADDLRERPDRFARRTRDALLPGEFVSADDYIKARRLQALLTAAVEARFGEFDVLLTASSMTTACRIDDDVAIGTTYLQQARTCSMSPATRRWR